MQRFYKYALRLGFVLACVGFVGVFVPPAAAQTAVPPPPVPMNQLDMTGDDLVTTSDVTRVVSAWLESQQVGQCSIPVFAQRDVNQDGCIDVVDAQLVAAQLGAVSGPNPPLLGAAARAAAVDSTFVVNSKGNAQDSNPNDNLCATGFTITVSGKTEPECTLRAAIQQANFTAGHETVTFNVRNPDGSCPDVVTIAPPKFGVPAYQSGEEDLAIESYFAIDDTNNYGMTIDGYTQCGARPNNQDVQGNAVIKIELKGQRQIYGHGILISSDNNIIRGLAIYDWDRKIMIDSNAKNNRIQGNLIGTNAAQTSKEPNMATMHSEGVRIQFGPSYNIIGCGEFQGTTFVPCTNRADINAARNMVIGNGNDGVHLQGNTSYNRIVGNYIGLRQDGETCNFTSDWLTNRDNCGNGSDAVDFESGPQYNWLGGETAGERNVISGNGSDGIEVSHSRNTKFNRIVGNYFGMNAAGNKAVRNINNGISYEDTVNNNTSYNNIVSGNAGNGLRFYNSATLNEFRNNIVGFAADGVTPLPNGLLNSDPSLPASERKGDNGVLIMGGSHNNLVIGNRIANQPGYGILLTHSDTDENRDGLSTSYNTISKNSIYNNGKNGIFWWNSETDANMNIAAPKLTLASTRLVTGNTCAGCRVEVFIADTTSTKAAGSGKTFIGEGVADSSGNFVVSTQQTAKGQVLTATTTDPEGNTSQFSMNIQVTQDSSVFETATATAQAAQTATAQAAATQTTVALATDPALVATATAQAAQTATAQAAISETATAAAAAPSPTPAQSGGKYIVLLPMITR